MRSYVGLCKAQLELWSARYKGGGPGGMGAIRATLGYMATCFFADEISEPLMYRHVHINNPAAARMLSERISHLSAMRDIDIWCWVRTFHEKTTRPSEVTLALFTKAVNLIEVQTNVSISSELLATLRQSCHSLRSLKVWVDMVSHGAIAQMGLFQHVTQLDVVAFRSKTTLTTDPLTDVPPWNMPAVTHFRWRYSRSNKLCDAIFMSRCRFPHLTHLAITLADRSTDRNVIPHLCHLLDAHRNIISLRISVRDEYCLTIAPFVRAQNLQMACSYFCPPRAFVPLLRPEVTTLGLEFGSVNRSCENHKLTVSLSELLTQFAAEDDAPPTLDTIRLISGKLESEEKERLLSVVRSHAPTLSARGIRVFVHDA
jgi:hypothetical protein